MAAYPSDSLSSLITDAAARFAAQGLDSPRLSAEVLLAAALGLSRSELIKRLILEPHERVNLNTLQAFQAMRARREEGEPVAYITGVKEFYGRPFAVSRATLVPRPETELLVDLALARLRGKEAGLVVDFGTGSGCIALTLALEKDAAGLTFIGLDKSLAAVRMARRNAITLGGERGAGGVFFLAGDFAAPPFALASCDVITANPPYVSREEYEGLSPEVRLFEPESALVPERGTILESDLESAFKPALGSGLGSGLEPGLESELVPACGPAFVSSCPGASEEWGVGGEMHNRAAATGYEDIARILASAHPLLKPGGALLMEMGAGQGPRSLALAGNLPWSEARVHSDLAGHDRVLEVVK